MMQIDVSINSMEFEQKNHRLNKFLLLLSCLPILPLEAVVLIIGNKFIKPKLRKSSIIPPCCGVNDYEDISFYSRDGVLLNGWLLHSKGSKKTLIMCHGYGQNRLFGEGKTLEIANEFIKAGYNVIMFDFRGHGNSELKHVTIGYNEQQDLLGAIDFAEKKGIAKKIGVMGFSMGAATALSCLDKTNTISFAIADSPFSDLKSYLGSNLPNWTGMPKFLTNLTMVNMKYIYGINFDKVSPIKSVQNSEVPILLLHGYEDTVIPYSDSEKIAENFKNPKSKLLLFQYADHIKNYVANWNRYRDALINFISDL
ncbi:MAG: alpha/beta fold hydrolase [Bacillota bacterium]|nr:alpha/beta fold hydrolase [Bacillota bacterium]